MTIYGLTYPIIVIVWITGIACSIIISIFLVRISKLGAVVTNVFNTVTISVNYTVGTCQVAWVTCVANSIPVYIFLIWVVYTWTVVLQLEMRARFTFMQGCSISSHCRSVHLLLFTCHLHVFIIAIEHYCHSHPTIIIVQLLYIVSSVTHPGILSMRTCDKCLLHNWETVNVSTRAFDMVRSLLLF